MKKILSLAAVALFLVAMTGCCCMKGKQCDSKEGVSPMPEASPLA